MPSLIRKVARYSAILSFLITGHFAHAATPTAAQVAQFQSLSPSQQQAVAQQLGVDMSASSTSLEAPAEVEPVKAPKRATTKVRIAQGSGVSDSASVPWFGYDLFAGKARDFSAIDNMPVPLDYVIGPGDEIQVMLFGKTEKNYRLKVDREGKITFPELGPEYVAGKSFEEVRQHIKGLVKRKVIGVETEVSLGSLRAMQVFVAGDVEQPGAYNVNGITTISQLLTASGGIKHTGSLRAIQLKRRGKVVSEFDVYDMLLNGDASQDVRLMAGDTLFVPLKTNDVVVRGHVLRPAHYELNQHKTIKTLIEYAGGTQANAFLSQVNVVRYTPEGKTQITLDLTKPQNWDFELHNGDQVTILAMSDRLNQAVALRGEVVRQGAYNFKRGMRITDLVSNARRDLKQTADLEYALVVRENPLSGHIRVIQFNLSSAIQHPQSSDDIALQEGDQVFVFDNGIDSHYWYQRQSNGKVSANNIAPKQVEVLDRETGAMVTRESEPVGSEDMEQVAKAEVVKQSSRAVLLKPIIERIKAQASIHDPAKLIEITGAVKFPGVYPLAQNSTFASVIDAAGGLTEQAYLYKAELSRYQKTRDSFNVLHQSFSPQQVLAGQSALNIEPQDNIIIKTQPDWQKGNTIELQGEVVFPGTYAFQRGETLSDVITRAGGLTSFAYPQGAVFSRDSLKRQEQERLKMLNLKLKQEIGSLALRRQTANASYTSSPNEAMAVANQLAKAEAVGRLVIDLPDALAQDPTADLMLEKGDKLYIPAKRPVVSVMGEVQFASNHTFDQAMSVEDYISAAGGTKKQADVDRIYVVRADGSVYLPNNSFWFSRQSTPLEPGDTIIVPIDTDYLDGLSTLTSATQILYQIGVAWSAIK
ncbi:SLBB domain-containing protein [Vibrio olivae]|uniref:SLBB domain-containing protein n=1 Tax=Vibrio olivae TaxID=1243002 RepID=A0ABV5HRV4_9VIBR